jgi:hypothetical protein
MSCCCGTSLWSALIQGDNVKGLFAHRKYRVFGGMRGRSTNSLFQQYSLYKNSGRGGSSRTDVSTHVNKDYSHGNGGNCSSFGFFSRTKYINLEGNLSGNLSNDVRDIINLDILSGSSGSSWIFVAVILRPFTHFGKDCLWEVKMKQFDIYTWVTLLNLDKSGKYP